PTFYQLLKSIKYIFLLSCRIQTNLPEIQKDHLMKHIALIAFICLFIASPNARAQRDVNYEESKVPSYKLPELLKTRSGKKVTDKQEWTAVRRKEIVEDFEKYVYGKTPNRPMDVTFEVHKIDKNALG